jgi:YegS/Rv2252/BmrU family lipid kinase
MPVPHAKVIVNPVAGGRSVRGEWLRIREQLHDVGLSFDYEFTEGAGHAVEIARRSTDAGYGYLIAVGGDGTVNEVVNGILCSTHSSNTTLGIISTGTGGSFARSLNIAHDYDSACSLLTGTGRASIDVGVIQCWSQGRPLQRFFVNAANVGLGAAIVDTWKRLPTRLGRNINHALRITEGLRSLSTYRNKWIKLSVGNKVETICACAVVVANGQYFADGMQIAPQARLDDGLLDVVTFGDVGKSELLKIWPTLYKGSHIRHPKIRERKATAVTIESDEQLLIEADGDIIGESPVSFSVIPSALTVVV